MMTRTNKPLAYAACAAAVLLGLAGATAQAVHSPPAAKAGANPSAGTPRAAAAATDLPAARSTVRIVAPGERVEVTRQASVWLSEYGRQCDQVMRARSCTVTITDKASVGLVTGTTEAGRIHWIGDVTAARAARVVVRDANGAHEATLVTLAGKPGWGAWYADMPAPPESGSRLPESLTVYDAAGEVVVRQKLT